MTTYSEWIIIPKDRTCDLPPDAKVQVMLITDSAQRAENHRAVEPLYKNADTDGLWFADVFAYRVVQEPVEEVREHVCDAVFGEGRRPVFNYLVYQYEHDFDLDAVRGIATQTTRDGKPYRFTWEASE
jgi:hypothetical protein